MGGGDPCAGRTPALALGETGIPPSSSTGSGPRAAHAIPGSILPGSSSPPVGFPKPQSESVPPTWLLVPGGTASLPGTPALPRGSRCTPTPLQSSWSGGMPSLPCEGKPLGFFAPCSGRWGEGYKPGLREGTVVSFSSSLRRWDHTGGCSGVSYSSFAMSSDRPCCAPPLPVLHFSCGDSSPVCCQGL